MSLLNDCGHPVGEERSVLVCDMCEAEQVKKREDLAWNAGIEAAAKKLDELASEHEALADAQHGKSKSEHDQRESMGGACRHAALRIRALKREAE